MPRTWSLAIALAIAAAYLALTPRVSGDKDSAEFTLVLALNGVAHPTGYPIFCLLGHLWTRGIHALGFTWAYAANSWSAVGGGAAIYLMHRLGCALIPAGAAPGRNGRFLLALLPVALLAFNPIWTYETTLAEVYSWHVAWVLGTCLHFVRLVGSLTGPGAWSTRRLHLQAAGWGLMCGLGGAHHATSLLVAVPFSAALLVVLARAGRLAPTLPIVSLAAALVPLGSYGILYWRAAHPGIVQWPALTPGLDGLLYHVTGRQYAARLGRFAPGPEQVRMLTWYVWPFLGPGLALLVADALRARGPGPRAVARAAAVAALGGAAWAFGYAVEDPSSYFLLPMVLGLAWTVPFGARLLGGGPTERRAARVGLAALAVTALGLGVPWTRTSVERASLYAGFDRYLHSLWMSIPFDTAFVFWANDMTYKLQERQLLGGEKRGLLVYHPLFVASDVPRSRFIARHGIDPAAALTESDRQGIVPGMSDSLIEHVVASVEQHVNGASPWPVIHFDAERGSVRLLVKSAAEGRRPDRPSGPDSLRKANDHPR